MFMITDFAAGRLFSDNADHLARRAFRAERIDGADVIKENLARRYAFVLKLGRFERFRVAPLPLVERHAFVDRAVNVITDKINQWVLVELVSGVVFKGHVRRDRRAFVAERVNLRQTIKIPLARACQMVVKISVRHGIVRNSFPEDERQILVNRAIHVKTDIFAVNLLQDFFL